MEKEFLTNLLDSLDGIIDELTRPIPYIWVTDHGTMMYKSVPCLLDQLRETIEECEKRPGSGRGRKNHPDLLDFRALDLEQDIKSTADRYYRKYKGKSEELTDTKDQLRSWAIGVRRQETHVVEEAFRLLNRYRNAILEIFNPHSVEIRSPCPKCNMRYAQKTVDGQKIRSSALKANSDEVICTACGYIWDNSRFSQLAKQLEPEKPKHS